MAQHTGAQAGYRVSSAATGMFASGFWTAAGARPEGVKNGAGMPEVRRLEQDSSAAVHCAGREPDAGSVGLCVPAAHDGGGDASFPRSTMVGLQDQRRTRLSMGAVQPVSWL